MSNEDPSGDLAQDLGYDEDGSTPSERDLEDTAEARLRDELRVRAELRAARREERWHRMVEFIRLFTWWA